MASTKKPFKPNLLATAIGSVPDTHPEAAVELILKALPEGPFWPQLPALDYREGMMVQYTEGIPGIRHDEAARTATLDMEEAAYGLEAISQAFADGDLETGRISPDFSRGLYAMGDRLRAGLAQAPTVIKGHVTGPVTQALALETSYEGRAAIYEPELARMLAQMAGLKARFQEDMLSNLVSAQTRTVIFFDEPSLAQIGSAVLNLDASLARELLATATSACHGLTGIHCCGETDFGLVAQTGVDVINFDAFDYLDSVAAAKDQVQKFLKQGGMLAIGIVPSSLPHPEAVAGETVDSLWTKLLEVFDTIAEKGTDQAELASQSFVTPSCGTSGMKPELAKRTLELTFALSAKARAHFGLQ